MAKMFYTLSEAASKLGMSEDDVRGLIESGQLQEFRDGDQIMLKVDQVDLLGGGESEEEDEDMIPLADSSDDLSPAGSNTGYGLADSSASDEGAGGGGGDEDQSEQTGISIFDPEGDEDVDPAAATQVSSTGGGWAETQSDFGSGGASGSGLANIAAESEDTNVGADLLEDVYGGDEAASGAPAGSGLGGSAVLDTGGDLFESPAGAEEVSAQPQTPAAVGGARAEPYDGPGSGIFGGLAFGTVAALLIATTIAIIALTGAGSAMLNDISMTVVYGVAGGGLGLMLLASALGWFLLRKG